MAEETGERAFNVRSGLVRRSNTPNGRDLHGSARYEAVPGSEGCMLRSAAL
jgi:hypothetical protein